MPAAMLFVRPRPPTPKRVLLIPRPSLSPSTDGTPGGYYFAKGTDPSLWLVYLEGGYWCWDGPSCQERYQTLKFDMSSSGWGNLFAQSGIFGTDPSTNPWANANMVFIKYCSSDSWFGDAAASSETFGFAFRGSRIVSATIAAMQKYNGLGSSGAPERLLFGGCSAGGRGVLVNLDAVAAIAPANVQVQGLLDAAAWVDVQPIIPNMLTLQDMTQDLYGFTSPPIPADCAAAYPGNEWQCLWPSYRLPFVQTNYFLNAAQFDAFQIMYDTNNLDSTYCCNTPAEQQWVEQFQVETLSLIQAMPADDPVYSSVCLVHCLSCNADFWLFTVNGVSLAQAMSQWYFSHQPVNVIGQCTGWDCTLQCSGGPWEPTNQPCTTTTNVCANDYYLTPSTVGAASGQVQPGSPPDGTPQQQQQWAQAYNAQHNNNQQSQASMQAWNQYNTEHNTDAQSQFNSVSQQQQPQQQQQQQQSINNAATDVQVSQPGSVSATESSLSAQQQQLLACQTQVQTQQAVLAEMQASDNPAASQIQTQLQAQMAQCAQLQQQGRR